MPREQLTGEVVKKGIDRAFQGLKLGPSARLMLLSNQEIEVGERTDRKTSMKKNWPSFLESFRAVAAMIPTTPPHGNFIPVLVEGKAAPYRLICGARRVAANLELGFHTWAISLPTVDDTTRRRYLNWENTQRADHTSAEMLDKVQEHIGKGLNLEQVAMEVGISLGLAKLYSRILKHPELAEGVRSESLTVYQVRELFADVGANSRKDMGVIGDAINFELAGGAEAKNQDLPFREMGASAPNVAANGSTGNVPKKRPRSRNHPWVGVSSAERAVSRLDKTAANREDLAAAFEFYSAERSEISARAKKEGWLERLKARL
jgi:hypothetical protein